MANVIEDTENSIAVGERCEDFDEDCRQVKCKLTCWMYDLEKGYCPYLLGTMHNGS